ncbi:MAG: RsmE family RNA methyltransferase [Planctomycetota bacterium]
MAHLRRFYSEDVVLGGKIALDPVQSNHLKNVLRLKPGAKVEVFNSHNESFLAEVSGISAGGGVELKILSLATPKNPALQTHQSEFPSITLACAIAKGSRMDWLIEKAAEIGLNRLIPVITERTVAKPNFYSQNKIARWHKLALSAARQTGQNSILVIDNPIPFSRLESVISGFSLSLIAVPKADKYLPEALEKSNLSAKDRILYLIGPEGDFTPKEIANAMKWGIQPVRLPVNSILRVETAAITMLAMLLYERVKMKDKR